MLHADILWQDRMYLIPCKTLKSLKKFMRPVESVRLFVYYEDEMRDPTISGPLYISPSHFTPFLKDPLWCQSYKTIFFFKDALDK